MLLVIIHNVESVLFPDWWSLICWPNEHPEADHTSWGSGEHLAPASQSRLWARWLMRVSGTWPLTMGTATWYWGVTWLWWFSGYWYPWAPNWENGSASPPPGSGAWIGRSLVHWKVEVEAGAGGWRMGQIGLKQTHIHVIKQTGCHNICLLAMLFAGRAHGPRLPLKFHISFSDYTARLLFFFSEKKEWIDPNWPLEWTRLNSKSEFFPSKFKSLCSLPES